MYLSGLNSALNHCPVGLHHETRFWGSFAYKRHRFIYLPAYLDTHLSVCTHTHTCTCIYNTHERTNRHVYILHYGNCRGAMIYTTNLSVWFLVGNGGMGYWDYHRGPFIGIHSPIPYEGPDSYIQSRIVRLQG